MAQATNGTQEFTIALPKVLIRRLRKQIPARLRSEFVAGAIEERLAIAEQVVVLEETAGAWKEEDYPEMRTPEDIDRWLATLRGTWPERLATLLEAK